MRYRPIEVSEYHSLVKLHLMAFDDFFLSTLGYNFLKTYYQACLINKESIAIGASDESKNLVGFCIGCTQAKGFHKRLVFQHFFKFVIQGIILLISKPRALWRLAINMEKNKISQDDGNYAELLSIGVLPTAKGSGIGKQMIRKFEEEARSKGCKKVALTTDFHNNEKVIEFYKNNGYHVFYEFKTFPNRRMYKMIKSLD